MPRQKANLSHWIYRQNLEAGLLSPPSDLARPAARHDVMHPGLSAAELARRAPRLDYDSVMARYDRTPSALERRLCLMRELLLQQDTPLPTDKINQHRVCTDYEGFRAAAAGVTEPGEEEEFWGHLEQKGWVIRPPRLPEGIPISLESRPDELLFNRPAICTLDARLWVEEQLREGGTGQRAFVAMWFDEFMDEAYDKGFARSITLAGYEPYRVDQDAHHSDKLDDRILAGIRQSRIVVADFTCETFIRKRRTECEGLANANVHYEAGFAHGLGLPVIYTCQEKCKDYLRFDTRQINHIFWTDAADLARQLQARLEDQFGQGPVQEAPDA